MNLHWSKSVEVKGRDGIREFRKTLYDTVFYILFSFRISKLRDKINNKMTVRRSNL